MQTSLPAKLSTTIFSFSPIRTALVSFQSIRSNEGLTLETSAFQIFHGGNLTLINSFDKFVFLVFLCHNFNKESSATIRAHVLIIKLLIVKGCDNSAYQKSWSHARLHET